VVAKRRKAVVDRLERAGSGLLRSLVVAHDTAVVAAAIADLARDGADPILVFGASAIVDRGDVVPAAVVAAGGEVTALGMPVDPGNLLMLGRIGTTRVIGVPSCASSPKENGFDWVLERSLAGLPLSRRDIVEMGAGGLLMEIETRPQPRDRVADPAVAASRIAAVVLAAGRSTRMGARNKLLEEIGGKPIVRHVAEAVAASRCDPVLVVTGHQADRVAGALAGLDVHFVHNADYAAGISTSLRCGIAAVPTTADGAMVLLGDMPGITGRDIDAIAACFNPLEGRSICVPVRGGRRGNPVLWGRSLFAAIMSVTGDTGARHLLASHDDCVAEVAVDSDAIFNDVDTPDALEALRRSAT
jgi:molybdenum cofactor cytidylyltransferase